MSDQRTTVVPLGSATDIKAVIEAERMGVPFLQWRDCEGAQEIFILPADRERVTIGRRAESDVPLVWDPEVSRAHALLERVGAQWTVLDDGLSSNGSFVNGNRVLGRQRLGDRDRLCFGQTQVVYREPAEGSDSTARVLEQATAVPLSPMQRKVLIALCRPVNDSTFATPATNKQIADEVFLSVDAVKAHLRVLFDRFGVGELPQNEKRARLAALALTGGALKPRDF